MARRARHGNRQAIGRAVVGARQIYGAAERIGVRAGADAHVRRADLACCGTGSRLCLRFVAGRQGRNRSNQAGGQHGRQAGQVLLSVRAREVERVGGVGAGVRGAVLGCLSERERQRRWTSTGLKWRRAEGRGAARVRREQGFQRRIAAQQRVGERCVWPPVDRQVSSLKGSCGLSANVASSLPVLGFGVSDPCSLTDTFALLSASR